MCVPMRDRGLPDRLQHFASRFAPPQRGRYVATPAQVDDRGVVALPRPPFDLVPLATAGALLLAGIALGSGYVEEQFSD